MINFVRIRKESFCVAESFCMCYKVESFCMCYKQSHSICVIRRSHCVRVLRDSFCTYQKGVILYLL